MTNADRIRQMSDDELAKWFCDLAWIFPKSVKGWLNWLKQEAKDG